MKIIYLNSESAKKEAIELIIKTKIDDKIEVILEKKKDRRSYYQNRLYWMMLQDASKTDINEYSGWTQKEWHEFFKEEFLVNIFERDDEHYHEMVESIREVYRQGMKVEAEYIFKNAVVNLTSTTNCDIKQFNEYLSLIMRWLNEKGISYRLPEDLKNNIGI